MEENNLGYRPKKERSAGSGCLIALIVGLTVLVGILAAALFFSARDGFDRLEAERDTFVDRAEQWLQGVLDDGSVHIGYAYRDDDSYTTGSAEIETRNVNRVVIDWVSGSVTVETYDSDTISVSEPEQPDEADRLRWRQKGDTLTIRYCAAGNMHLTEGKDLVVKLPKDLADNLQYLQIDTVSAEAHVSGVTAGELQFDSVSGSLDAAGGFGILDADTTSGGLVFTGTANAVELDTVSGDYSVSFTQTPDALSFDSTSGDLTVMLPANRSFEVEQDTASGNFKCDFALVWDDDPYYKGTETGVPAELEFDTISGDIWIMNARWA